jgi:hypothetical protein
VKSSRFINRKRTCSSPQNAAGTGFHEGRQSAERRAAGSPNELYEVSMGRVMIFEEDKKAGRKYCCHAMTYYLEQRCRIHDSPFECPDNVIYFHPRFREHGIIVHDGSKSYLVIQYCPWCGKRLPKSLRSDWFAELEKLGFEDPMNENIPAAYRSDKWYSGKTARR